MYKIDNLKKVRMSIFKLYLYLLPIRMINIGMPIQNIFGSMATYTTFVLHIIGMLLIILSVNKKEIKMNKFIKNIIISIFLLNLSSIIMAMILYDKLGILHGESTYNAILGQIIYFFHILTIFIYNSISLQEINFLDLKDILYKIIIYILTIGYMQIIVLSNVSIFNTLYDKIDIFNILSDSDYLIRLDRITLTGSEPASAGILLSVLIIPYILSNIITENEKRKYRLLFILYFPLVYWTKSSTTYILFFVNITIFAFYMLKNKWSIIKTILCTLTLCVVILIGSLYTINSSVAIKSTSSTNEIYYLLVEKITDKNNLSTVHRSTTLINDFKVFMKYPLLGIGNGNQGFYYNENIPSHALRSVETLSIYNGEQGVINGGPFVPAYISGYGIFGILVFIIFLKKSKIQVNSLKDTYLYYLYLIGGITFLIAGCMSTDIVGNYFIIFIASIPFVSFYNGLLVNKSGKYN